MSWETISCCDPRGRELADRHYPRRNHGARRFVPPGSPLVLFRPGALWVSLKQKHQDHAWPGAWVCTLFRNETKEQSSRMIIDCVALTLEAWGNWGEHRMISFVDPKKTAARRGRANLPGHCFRMAGWQEIGQTKGGHGRNPLIVLQAPGVA